MMYFISTFTTRVQSFLRSESGYLTLESLIMIPILVWTFTATLSYYDIFRSKNMVQKATYTVSNLITRTRVNDTLPAAAFNGYYDLINYLTYQKDEVSIRITLYTYLDSTKKYSVKWSCPKGSHTALKLTDATLNNVANRLPKLASGDYSILVESWVNYQPILNLNGLITGDVHNDESTEFIVTRPRAGVFNANCPT